MLVALGFAAAFAQDCPSTTADLARVVADADSAFIAMDLAAFHTAEGNSANLLRCLNEPLTPIDAAGVHRVRALAAFVDEDTDWTIASLRAVLNAMPHYVLPERLAPPGTPLAEAFEAARAAGPGPIETLSPPEGTWLTIDGVRSVERPLERPAVLQALADTGAVRLTTWLPPDVEAPDWAHVPPVDTPPPTPDARPARKAPLALLVASGSAAVLAGSTYGLAWAGRGAFDDPSTPLEDVAGIRSRTNALVVTSAAFAGVAVGTGGAAVVVWTR